MKTLPADHAEQRMTALTMWSRTGMAAFLMPTTKGEEPAPAPPEVSSGALDGHVSVTPRMGRT